MAQCVTLYRFGCLSTARDNLEALILMCERMRESQRERGRENGFILVTTVLMTP